MVQENINKRRVRMLAFYLPQFHPIPENDEWWGKGFTEWTNVGNAKPLFKGHYQPRVPADLGYYDLRVPEVQEAQARMAQEAGIEGFCYWHYWFGNGKQLLEMPFNKVLESGKPDFPFCLAWANESWKGFQHGLKNRNTLIEQEYPGEDDIEAHFYYVLKAFNDSRYIRYKDKPIFVIYKPNLMKNIEGFIEKWNSLAKQNGLEGICFVAHHPSPIDFGCKTESESFELLKGKGFDKVIYVRLTAFLENRSLINKLISKLNKWFRKLPLVYPYKKHIPYFSNEFDKNADVVPSIISGWDHSPRSGKEGSIMTNFTPDLFEKHVKNVLDNISNKPFEDRIVFLKSWNEWGEGNYIEPDLRFGKSFLEVLKRQILEL